MFPKNRTLIFRDWTFLALRIKKTPLKKYLIFWKIELLAPSLKSSYISGGNLESPKL